MVQKRKKLRKIAICLFTFPRAWEWAKWASEQMSEHSGACTQSEQCGASERANGWASGPVLTFGFLIILTHSVLDAIAYTRLKIVNSYLSVPECGLPQFVHRIAWNTVCVPMYEPHALQWSGPEPKTTAWPLLPCPLVQWEIWVK